ncbi:Phosphatidylinositol binding [Tyrophagus putrescentiae]|nr:Phosphatidylinositol binding [Tyrophagus putrescentiae]
MKRSDALVSSTARQPRQKANILSTYLVSDEEDDGDDTCYDDNLFSGQNAPLNSTINERIEVLGATPISTLPRSSTFDFSGCDYSSTAINASSSTVEHRKSLPSSSSVWCDNTIESSTPRRSQYRISFEIIRAKTVTPQNGAGKYVSYTILIKRSPGLETQPALINRRYSDFLSFYKAIRQRHPLLLKDFSFPRKNFIGNFSAQVIAERSLAFQEFLAYCLSVPEIRSSKEFFAFLYYPELQEAKRCLLNIQLEEAASLFENVHFILEKLTVLSGKPSTQIVHTLCCLTATLNAVDNTVEAKKMALRTFEILFANDGVISLPNNSAVYEVTNLYESSELVLPLIILSLRLRWFTGQQKLLLEQKLEEMCRKRSLPRNFESHPTLLELILKPNFSPILN